MKTQNQKAKVDGEAQKAFDQLSETEQEKFAQPTKTLPVIVVQQVVNPTQNDQEYDKHRGISVSVRLALIVF